MNTLVGWGLVSPLAPRVPWWVWLSQEEDQEDAGAVAPGLAPKMSAAKAAKTAAEKDARIAVSKTRGLSFRAAAAAVAVSLNYRTAMDKRHFRPAR